MVISAVIGAACGGSSNVAVGEVPTELPTSTPNISPTDLPPPTVTPFPAVTPRSEPVTVDAASGEDEDSEGSDEAAPSASGSPFDGTILYETNFARGWPNVDDDTADISSSGGEYIWALGPFDARFFTTNGIEAGDSYTQVDVTVEECPPEGGYGLIFRYTSESGYYQFTLFCSGTYSGLARVDGRPSGGTSGDTPFDPSEATTRTLGVLADGADITLLVDGDELDRYTDTRFETGDAGVYAISQTGDVINVRFSNMQVYALP